MPQKKRAKMKKPAAKRQLQKGILDLAEKVEKEFRQIPTKLAKLYRQELLSQKQQESHLKTEIKKTEALQKSTQKKVAILLKTKTDKSTKKPLAAAKKSNQEAAKKIKLLTTKLNQIIKNNSMLLAKQYKYIALNKEFIKLEKQLTLKTLSMAKAKPAAKKTKAAKPKQVKLSPQQANLEKTLSEETPFMISSNKDLVEV